MYELWWRDSLNVTAIFRTEQEALASLRKALRQHGRDYVAGFILERLGRGGDRTTVAAGQALAALAEAGGTPADSSDAKSVGAATADRRRRARTVGARNA